MCKKVAESIDMQLEEFQKGKIRYRGTIPDLQDESAWLWVHECYGVDFPTIRLVTENHGHATWEFCKWLELQRLKSHHI